MDTNTNPYSKQNPEQWFFYPQSDFKNPNPDPNNYPNNRIFCDINFYNNNNNERRGKKIVCKDTIVKVDEKTFYLSQGIYENAFFPFFFLALAIFTALPFMDQSKMVYPVKIILISLILIFIIVALYCSLASFNIIHLLLESNSIVIKKKLCYAKKL